MYIVYVIYISYLYYVQTSYYPHFQNRKPWSTTPPKNNGSTKRKRAHEELDEALRENERVYTTPVQEDKDARKRRQTKRRKRVTT
ncbi:hypothetical protein F444_05958 [Phytophthora nicotianae P1976]|uniref:Uncharacterized protein n=2 Tax=Phytophthora nicotianae TaxID=4792 RepID=A0A081AKB6_PHYNI|nr:hypothetical protein F444_05958 [Phytophthora nicotianae P1976]